MTNYRAADEICWLDLKSANIAAAQTFYQAVLSWHFKEEAWSNRMYTTIYVSNGKLGGFTDLNASIFPLGTKPHMSIYMAVDNVDQTVAKVEEAGGTILIPSFDMAEFGRMAVIQDNVGAVISIWEPRRFKGMNVDATREGAQSWFELETTDIERSYMFYREVFDWTLERIEDHSFISVYGLGGKRIGGMKQIASKIGMTQWNVGYTVKDVDETRSKALSLGASLTKELHHFQAGRRVDLIDPEGVPIILIEHEK
ncbi:VOC family protein [Paenibacillus sp. SC116]|uniref:VOC family protein n=1 Tax=Paenibacillus sp. SC116 TaxID=2968986 RepID=UPI00215AB5CF|nr:VOC family protein [Paenibacillus sp. SC116]MCR8843538.1 VOC family protein [Paenibacillus sp. SC116]